jgi:DNA repair protein RecN (Recombination protein N)
MRCGRSAVRNCHDEADPSGPSVILGRMLLELRVENLLLIERAELRLAAGLNILTGETGAGKTVLAHALDLLLGGRARQGIVRPGAEEAYVEGVFEGPDGEDVVLARRVTAAGRTRAYVNGRWANVADLQELAQSLLSFHGQHEHRKLMLTSAQLELLDAFCGPEHLAARAELAGAHARVRELEGSLVELRELAGARDRELDLLEFELAEIDAAAPDEAEKDELVARRERLRHLTALRGAAAGASEAVAPDEGGGAATSLAAAVASLEGVAGVDAALDELTARARSVALEADDVAAELRRYAEDLDGIGAHPPELEAVEERLAVIDRLERKHGGSIAAVLAHADRCRARRDELAGAEVALEEASARLAEAQADLTARAAALSATRAEAAPRLADAVRARLSALAMDGASFEIALEPREEVAPTGADAVEFMIAPNPGVPAAPLRDTASGGEASRVMLALLAVANEASDATLVFDEVDAGIGGQTARAVGEELRALASGRQILCITHLPQIASLAARHFAIEKDPSVEPARTTVRELAKTEVVGELVRMLGAEADDVAARRHAKELLKAA